MAHTAGDRFLRTHYVLTVVVLNEAPNDVSVLFTLLVNVDDENKLRTRYKALTAFTVVTGQA